MLDENSNTNLHPSEQTIFAWASAVGRAGVAVLRLSGKHCAEILADMGVSSLPSPRYARLLRLYHPQDESLIDHCLCLYFNAPHSFTGEDVVELHTHGSPAIISALTDLLSAHPLCRMAEAGEFSRRAFENNKMDLVEAEGLADLIDAHTPAQHAQALRQLGGSVGAQYESIRTQIIHALAMMEAYIDFPDEEIPEEITQQTNADIIALKNSIDSILDDGGVGEKIRDGLKIVILGAPNAGKSTLMNALAKRDVAIVSDQAGTTRDIIEVHLTLDGYSVTLVDTAGIRETNQTIEQEGIRRARTTAESADLLILLQDSAAETSDLTDFERATNLLRVNSKSDLFAASNHTDISISAKTGENMDTFIELLKEKCHTLMQSHRPPLITRHRHRVALEAASHYLGRFLKETELELMTENLRCATQEIAKITGRIELDDVLDVVFSSFCIGK